MEAKILTSDLGHYLNQEIISEYLVTQKELREGTKDFYLRLRLSDKNGSVMGNVWNNARAVAEKFKEGDVVRIKGMVISYRSQLQITINKIQVLDSEEYDLQDYIETTSKDITKLNDKLFQYIEKVGNKYLNALLRSVFEDKEMLDRFCRAPAAKTWHHNYMGGLLEHTVAVTRICDLLAHYYPVDRELLITGAILHDIGKIIEYNLVSAIDFTPEGRLLGHISLGDEIVCKRAAGINNFPPALLMKLRHLILSHHGEYEKASARLPQTIEAMMLHHADNLDAQVTGVAQLINSPQIQDSEWSEYDKLNNRFYYIK